MACTAMLDGPCFHASVAVVSLGWLCSEPRVYRISWRSISSPKEPRVRLSPPRTALRPSGKRMARSEPPARRRCHGNTVLPAIDANGAVALGSNAYVPALAVHFVRGSVKNVYSADTAARRSGWSSEENDMPAAPNGALADLISE